MKSMINNIIRKFWSENDFKDYFLEYCQDNPKRYLVELYASNKCNLRCKHCCQGKVKDETISKELWIETVNTLLPIAKQFHVSGKEPSADDTSVSLLNSLLSIKIKNKILLTTITNGQIYLPEMIDNNLGYLDNIEISIDGLEQENDYIRGINSFNNAISNLYKYMETYETQKISVCCALNKINIENIENYVTYFYNLGIKRLFFQVLEPIGRGELIRDLIVTPIEFLKFVKSIEFFIKNSHYIKGVELKICIPNWLINNLIEDTYTFTKLYNFIDTGCNYEEYWNDNIISFDFGIIDIPFWKNVIITQNGNVISNYSDYYFDKKSLVTISKENIYKLPFLIKNELNNKLDDSSF
jgi:MoaA/NifB/PqqE/SkfB family radical SAM enzyme